MTRPDRKPPPPPRPPQEPAPGEWPGDPAWLLDLLLLASGFITGACFAVGMLARGAP